MGESTTNQLYGKNLSIFTYCAFVGKAQVFKNSPILAIFGIFNELLSILNVIVARFAHNVECDFFSVIFKHREGNEA